MATTIQVSSREFRDHQKTFLDMAAKGKRVILRRGKKEAFAIVPMTDDDLYFTPEMLARIDKSLQSAAEGKVKTLTMEELDKLLGL